MKTGFKGKVILVLICVLLLHAFVNAHILYNSKLVRVYDEAGYITAGVEVQEKIARRQYKDTVIKLWRDPFPRKVFAIMEGLVLTLLDKIGLKDIDSMILFSNLLCLFILLVSTYKIGSILYSPKAGLLAAVLLSFSPIIFAYSRGNMSDFPLAAMVSLSLLCLLKTDNFRSRSYSVMTAIVFVLAQFTREIAIVFIAPPFLYYAFKSLSERKQRRSKRINFILTVLLSLLPTLIFYLRHSNQGMSRELLGKALILKASEFDIFYYLKEFTFSYLGWVFFIALVPLILHYVVNIRKRNLFLTLWLFVPLLVFSLSPNRVSRFLMPSLPAFFLLLSFELFSSLSAIRRIYAAVLIAAAVFQYAVFSFYPDFPLSRPKFHWGVLSARQDEHVYEVEKTVNIFKRENLAGGPWKRILFIFNLGWHSALNYEFRIRSMPLFAVCPQEQDHADAHPPGIMNWQQGLLSADYVMDKTGDLGRRGRYEDIAGKFRSALESNRERFKEIARFETQDGETIYIYRNIVPEDGFPWVDG